jgi:hypothetical protein
MWQKVINPKTGRNVSIYSKIGRKVLNTYILQLHGGTSKDSNKIYCKPMILIDQINDEIMRQLPSLLKLGEGKGGVVYDYNSYALKIPKDKTKLKEILIYHLLCYDLDSGCSICEKNILNLKQYNINSASMILTKGNDDLRYYSNYPKNEKFNSETAMDNRTYSGEARWEELVNIFKVDTKELIMEKMINQILNGLFNIHSMGIEHRDLEMKNILLYEKGVLLFDFGLSSIPILEMIKNADLYNTISLINGFSTDINNIFFILGNFIFSNEDELFQHKYVSRKANSYNLAKYIKNLDGFDILNNNTNLKNYFFILRFFTEVLGTISFLRFNQNIENILHKIETVPDKLNYNALGTTHNSNYIKSNISGTISNYIISFKQKLFIFKTLLESEEEFVSFNDILSLDYYDGLLTEFDHTEFNISYKKRTEYTLDIILEYIYNFWHHKLITELKELINDLDNEGDLKKINNILKGIEDIKEQKDLTKLILICYEINVLTEVINDDMKGLIENISMEISNQLIIDHINF